MPYVMNALPAPLTNVQAQGKYFSFKAGEIKFFHVPEIARFFGQMRGEEGLVEIPDHIMELEKNDQVRIDFLEEKRREGVNKRIAKLEWQKHNLLASLRLDLEVKGMKVDPLILASKGDVAAIKELNNLTANQAKDELSNADLIRKELGLDVVHTGNTVSGKNDPGHTNSVKSTKG